MKSDNTKGNPYHDEEGKFTSGDGAGKKSDKSQSIKLKDGVDLSNLFNSLKPQQVQNNAPKVDLSQKIIQRNLKAPKLAKGISHSFSAGTEEAQKIVADFFDYSGIIIKEGSACYSLRTNLFSSFFSGKPTIESAILFKSTDLSGVGKNSIFYAHGETFYHECFHGIDTEYFDKQNKQKCISCDHILSNGKTLKDVFSEEISSNQYSHSMKMFNEIKSEYEKTFSDELLKKYTPEEITAIDDNIDKLNSTFKSLNQKHRSGQIDYNTYVSLWKQNEKIFKEEYAKKDFARAIATKKYSVLSDFCSFIYRTGVSNSICGGHPRKYWSSDNGRKPIKEMFAEMGSMWSRNDTEQIALIQRYFPNTYNGFLEIVKNLDNIKGVNKR